MSALVYGAFYLLPKQAHPLLPHIARHGEGGRHDIFVPCCYDLKEKRSLYVEESPAQLGYPWIDGIHASLVLEYS